MLGPILGTRDPAVRRSKEILPSWNLHSSWWPTPVLAEPSQHPEPVSLPEPHSEQAEPCVLSQAGARVWSRPVANSRSNSQMTGWHPCTHHCPFLPSFSPAQFFQGRITSPSLELGLWVRSILEKRAHSHSSWKAPGSVCTLVSSLSFLGQG